MSHRAPGVSCVPEDCPVLGTIAFSPDVESTLLHSCSILPVLHSQLSIAPGENLGLSLGPIYQGTLEERRDDVVWVLLVQCQ